MRKLKMVLAASLILLLAACGGGKSATSIDEIVFADAMWDSIRVHNGIAGFIIEEGYGYDTDVTSGSTAATVQSMEQGDIQVYMELWKENVVDLYNNLIDSGNGIKVSTNFNDNSQGLYVPTYVIEGDPERGIEPVAPDLKTVADLIDYVDVFQDPEDSSKGRIVGAPSGWAVDIHLNNKIEAYGLEDAYNYLAPGSDASIIASLESAYSQGEPWVGYYWEPTWVTAYYDLTLLEEPPYDEDIWNENSATEFPPVNVDIIVHKDLPEQAPEVVDFLENYQTTTELNEVALNYMQENEADAEEAALWWMKEYEDVWTEWVPEDIAEKVKTALDEL